MNHIEKSGFRRGEYVGYVGGKTFRITRVLSGKTTIGWEAREVIWGCGNVRGRYLISPSLKGLDAKLAEA